MRKRHLLSILLVLSVFGALCSSVAYTYHQYHYADEDYGKYTSGDYDYILLRDGTVRITNYRGEDSTLVIPHELGGNIVSSIGEQAFCYSYNLTDVTIPDSVTSIEDNAFLICDSLTSITIPDSVKEIGTNPFEECGLLTDILVSPEHPYLETMEGVLFSKADKRLICYPCAFEAENYTIPEGVTVIGNAAFSCCENLKSITIPDSVTTIGDSAFYCCTNLTGVVIPDSVTTIGYAAFCVCCSLANVTISNNVTSIEDVVFARCDSLTNVTIPDKVTEIGVEAFSYCEKMASITIPDSVTMIRECAFDGCGILTVTVGRNTYAENYCIRQGLPYRYDIS